ncbi:MAG: autotransporter-associated beta strand repeat-containing protein [Pirellulales bacterium]
MNLADGTIGNFTITQGATFATAGAAFQGGALNFDIGGITTAADRIIVSGNTAGIGATSSGVNTINIFPTAGTTSLTPGSYTLIQATGSASTLSNTNFVLGTSNLVVNGTLYNLSLSGTIGTEVLTIATGGAAASPGLAFWTGNLNSSWKTQNASPGLETNFAAAATAGAPNTFALPDLNTNVYFTNATATNLNTTLDQNFTINSLNFTGSGSANSAGGTIDSGTGTNSLTINAAALNGNTAGSGLTVAAGAGINTIGANVVLGANQTWTSNSTNLTILGGTIGQSAAGTTLTKAGTGTIAIAGAAGYTGATTISAGTLQLGAGGTTGTLSTSSAIVNNATLAFNRSNTVTQGTDFNSTIGGTGIVLQNGPGTLILGGANTYTGNTVVAGGTLAIPTGGSLTGNGTTTAGSTLIVGNTAGQNAVFNLNGGSVNSYYTFLLGTNATAAGVLNMTGGTFTNTTTATGNTVNFVGQTGYGMLNITGGTFTAKGRFAPSNGVGTTGVVYVGGTGILDTSAGEWFLMAYSASGNAGLSQVTVGPGGQLLHAGATAKFGLNMDRSNGYAVLNVAGGTVTTSTQNITFGNGTAQTSPTPMVC